MSHDDPRRAEDRRLEVLELLERILEEAALAHHALGVERPTLAEVGRAQHQAELGRVDLAPGDVPVVAGIGLVDGRRRDAVLLFEARRFWMSSSDVPSGAIGHEEVARSAVGEGRRTAV